MHSRAVESFKSWFNIDVTSESSATQQIVTKLHAILKPFLLRRIKREVEKSLPAKKEYLLSAPLTVQQKKLYDAVLQRQIRDFLLARKDLLPESSDKAHMSLDEEDISSSPGKKSPGKKTSNKKRKIQPPHELNGLLKSSPSAKRARPSYAEVTDDDFLESLDDGTARDEAEDFENKRFGHIYAAAVETDGEGTGDEGSETHGKGAAKKINRLKLSNLVMQLRKVVNHVSLSLSVGIKIGEAKKDASHGCSIGQTIPRQGSP